MSELLSRRPKQQNENYRYVTISLEPSDRLALHARIADRYRAMIGAGLVDEVAALHRRPDLHPGLPSVRCVGYRQLWESLDGNAVLDKANDKDIAASRLFAQRDLKSILSPAEAQQRPRGR